MASKKMDTASPQKNRTAPMDSLKLDCQLCFALYISSKEIIRRYKPFLEPYHLTYTGYITMIALWEKDGRTVKEIGERLTLDSGTLTPLLKKLESLSYIERARSSEDERTVIIRLTEDGQKLKEQVKDVPSKVFRAANIDPEKTVRLTEALNELSSYLYSVANS